jgi:hypothetical protein
MAGARLVADAALCGRRAAREMNVAVNACGRPATLVSGVCGVDRRGRLATISRSAVRRHYIHILSVSAAIYQTPFP